MNLENKNIGFGICGSFCNCAKVIDKMLELKHSGANIIPIMSFNAYAMNTKYGTSNDFIEKIESVTGNKIIHTIQDAEMIGPKKSLDIVIIAPATGNTISKLANGINDSPITMAVKSNLRNNNPVVIGIATCDALSDNAYNIGMLLNRKKYYFVPFRQDNPITKPYSIVFDYEYIKKTLEYALDNEQIQPLLI